MVKANGTIAKDIAIYFLDTTTDRYTPSMVAKTINQAKQLLESGYTKDEIISAIDYVIMKTNVEMYSLGYINTTINDILKKMNEEEEAKKVKEILDKAKLEQATTVDNRGDNNESTERNRKKLERLDIQSRKRTKFDFDMLKR